MATLTSDDAHVPPMAGDVRVMSVPAQNAAAPERVPVNGIRSTVTVVEAVQLPNVYDTTVTPAPVPVTSPPVPTVAMLVFPLAHVPPAGVLLRVVVAPTHIAGVPVIAVGVGFTVRSCVAVAAPQAFVTV